nr:DinB family protein [Melghirimyces algeriensis]
MQYYLNELKHYTLEQLQYKPHPDQWSLGQMYNHLIQISLNMQFPAINQCLSNEAECEEEKTEAGVRVFQNGSFPPIKIKLSDRLVPDFTPAQPESKEELVSGLKKVLEQANEKIDRISSTPHTGKVAHPRFGALNVQEWFQLGEMHFRHHLRQKKELDQILGLS